MVRVVVADGATVGESQGATQRQVFWWRLKISSMVRVVEADGATVGESQGATLWLLQLLARHHWMLNELGGMGIEEEEIEGTIPVVPREIF